MWKSEGLLQRASVLLRGSLGWALNWQHGAHPSVFEFFEDLNYQRS